MKERLTAAGRFIWRWQIVGIVTNLSSALLLLPGAIPAWLVYGYLAPRLGWPALNLLDVFALIWLIRLCQASATINLPPESQLPDKGIKQ